MSCCALECLRLRLSSLETRLNIIYNTLRAEIAAIVTGASPKVLHLRETLPSGTNNAETDAATTYTRALNTVLVNEIGNINLQSDGTFTLPAGTYDIHGWAVGRGVGLHRSSLRDINDNVLILGANMNDSVYNMSPAPLIGHIILTAPTTIMLRHYVNTYSTNGLGQAINDGQPEVYADLFIVKTS